jgi:hypothetical protein
MTSTRYSCAARKFSVDSRSVALSASMLMICGWHLAKSRPLRTARSWPSQSTFRYRISSNRNGDSSIIWVRVVVGCIRVADRFTSGGGESFCVARIRNSIGTRDFVVGNAAGFHAVAQASHQIVIARPVSGERRDSFCSEIDFNTAPSLFVQKERL